RGHAADRQYATPAFFSSLLVGGTWISVQMCILGLPLAARLGAAREEKQHL
ncbi:MAG: hypothetical protein ACI9BK_000567, partial [Acidimicrobiales bacterium]